NMIDASENPRFQTFMQLVEKYRKMGVRTNADTPEDAKVARRFGAECIGLFRTEHMFYGEGSDEPLFLLRKMILSKTEQERRTALDELFGYMKRDIKATLEAMDGLPVTIRLLDPPLHEFVPQDKAKQAELAKALAWYLFDDENALVRIDMSEYREGHTVSRLFGAPPGYVGYEEGGQLTERVRRRPYQVVLFDEIEKAHPDVWNALLQILDDGRLTDGQGRVVYFNNTVIIMTSNLGTEYVRKGGTLGFIKPTGDEEMKMIGDHKKIEDALKRTFRPEFLNRVDEIIVFAPLSVEDVEKIVELQLREIRERLSEQGMQIELKEGARKWLARQGYDPNFGARPLRRAMQKYVEGPLSVQLLQGKFKAGDCVVIDVKPEGDGLQFMRNGCADEEPEPAVVSAATADGRTAGS
ncbi:MAG: AAA family ATPase, partial [Anaerolineae bacterium]|nr:AAA family ATPase [Anaerolineae bacterium]